MVSWSCWVGGYIVSRIGALGLEHKQKLDLTLGFGLILHLGLMIFLFAGSFG